MAEPKFTTGNKPEEYELLPHHELQQLKDEIRKLKEFDITPTKKMHVTMIELNHKLDKLITIFEDAMHEVRVEEGGLSFTDKMKPVLEKMNKILEQNSEIASGILAVADMIRGKEPTTRRVEREEPGLPPLPGLEKERPATGPPGMPPPPASASPRPPQPPPPEPTPKPPGPPPPKREPPLPPTPRKRSFGL